MLGWRAGRVKLRAQGVLWGKLLRVGLASLGFLLSALLVGCSEPSSKAVPPQSLGVDLCASEESTSVRRDFLERIRLPATRPKAPPVVRGVTAAAEGFTMTAVRWAQGAYEADWVHGLWLEPDPLPETALPLVVNVHGHWDAGVEADEVAFRSQLFAQQGWGVLTIATRGREHGSAAPPAFRAAHYADGLYGEMRQRRAGATPLAWNTVAAWSGIEAALAGRFSAASIDRDQIAVIGSSGGAEIATAVASSDPRIGAAVVGAFEYAFGTQDGHARCSCGALAGGDDASRRASWLAQVACRPGRRPQLRPVLAWDGRTDAARATAGPNDVLTQTLSALGPSLRLRRVPGVHGFSRPMAAASWSFLEKVLRGRARSPADEDTARIRAGEALTIPGEQLRMSWVPGTPGPGLSEQGPPPWKVPVHGSVRRASQLLGLEGEAGAATDPVAMPSEFGSVRVDRLGAAGGTARWAWVVAMGSGPQQGPASVAGSEAGGALHPSGLPKRDWRSLRALLPAAQPDAGFFVVTPRLVSDPATQERLARRSIERGEPLLGVAVQDLLRVAKDASDWLGGRPDHVGFVGLGSSGLPSLWAALLFEDAAPVVVETSPVSLWWDGPRAESKKVPTRPWPLWLLAPIPQGAALDPWPAGTALGARLRWVDPRGGDGGVWRGALPDGSQVEPDLAAALTAARGGPGH